MSINLSSNFNLVTQLPLDARYAQADTTARDAIPSIQRHEGLLVYTVADQTLWQLQGGITNSDWVAIGTGAPGADGNSVLSGSGAPTALTGSDGDFYIDLDTWDIYGPKTAGDWGSATSLVGPQGSAGPGVSVHWEGNEITATASKIDFKGQGITSVEEVAPGEIEVTIQGGGGDQDDFPKTFGKCDSPLDIDATGFSKSNLNMSLTAMYQVVFAQGSGGPVDITSNPQIGAHSQLGAELIIVGKSDVNTIRLDDGDGLKLNGMCILKENQTICLFWDGSMWVERRRSA